MRQQIYRTLYVRMPADDMSELFVWVDEQDRELGAITRAVAHGGSRKIHRSVVVIVLNQDKTKILFQQRSSMKDLSPNLWAIGIGGHVTYGDTYEASATREMQEELGITNAPISFVLKRLHDLGFEREFMPIYEAYIPDDTVFIPDPFEVADVLWCDLGKVREFVSSHQLCPDTAEILIQTGYLPGGV